MCHEAPSPESLHGTLRAAAWRRRSMRLGFALACVVTFNAAGVKPLHAAAGLQVFPTNVVLRGPYAEQQLRVTRHEGEARADVTAVAEFRAEPPGVVTVTEHGTIEPKAEGTATVVIRAGDAQTSVSVRVEAMQPPPPVLFERDVQPILTRHGCNSGPCHGKQRGQNGFQLSLLGFDDDYDYLALTKGSYARRLAATSPDRSLLFLKPTAELPHGGGRLFGPNDTDTRVLTTWLDSGMLRGGETAARLTSLSVSPTDRVMANLESQQLVVTAHYSDESTRDVTRLTTYLSSESPVAKVDERGLIAAGTIPGEATIMARYRGEIATCRVTIPLPDRVDPGRYAGLPRENFIDDLVWKKLSRLNILPSPSAPDAAFLRRVYLDAIGRLPSADEARAFLADTATDKRARLVDAVLLRDEYADHWANKWVDLLRPNPYRTGIKSVLNLDNWVRSAFRKNLPYDEFVRRIVTARGSTIRHGIPTVFRDRRSPDEQTTLVSQIFLGIRLECAKCHKHPFEIWTQDDFYSFAAYFARVGRKGSGLSPPISGGEEFILTSASGAVSHPKTGENLAPRPLFGSAPPQGSEDPRVALARWMTKDNPAFARVIVNRVWADLMGIGIVEPVDDFRATNPASNLELLDAIANDFVAHGHDLKHLLRRIMTSHVYGLSSAPTPSNIVDTRNYSRHFRQRLRAEVLLDAVCDVTLVAEEFDAVPSGSRSAAIWTHRAPSLFLDTFGRPDLNQDPPCYRTSETSVVQALHLMNAPQLHTKLSHPDGRVAQLAASGRSPNDLVEELYLLTYSRFPTARERETAEKVFERIDNRQEAIEDLLWALFNTAEFFFKN